MKKSQSGFTHVQLVLVAAVLIGAIGGTGYYVASKNKKPASREAEMTAAATPAQAAMTTSRLSGQTFPAM